MRYHKSGHQISAIGPTTDLAAAKTALHDAVVKYVQANQSFEHRSTYPNKFGFMEADELLSRRGRIVTTGVANGIDFLARTNVNLKYPLASASYGLRNAWSYLMDPTQYQISVRVNGLPRDENDNLTDPQNVETNGITFSFGAPLGHNFRAHRKATAADLDEILKEFPEIRQIAEQFERNLSRVATPR